MDALALVSSLALPWCAGCALLRLAAWPASPGTGGRTAAGGAGRIALTLGYGFFFGLLLLTLWMRALSAFGVGFGRWTIGAPLAVLAAGAIIHLARKRRVSFARVRAVARAVVLPPLPRWQRRLWIALLAWLALRFATLAAEVASRPLYPWDAWTQWATKARVWYALGRMAAFISADQWLTGSTGAYFDVSPSSPATVPLLQAWSAIALGRWDDAATNWPWLCMLLALALAAYGMLRDGDTPPLGALVGAWLVASLPFLDTHVALAGCPDLMLAGSYTLAALALYRWSSRRDPRDGVLALLLALACSIVDASGPIWSLTLVLAAIVAAWPRPGLRLVAWILVATILGIAVLAGETPLFGIAPRLHYAPEWRALGGAFFLSNNWNLLWYAAVVLTLLGGRRLVQPPLATLATVVVSALVWIAVAAVLRRDTAEWFPGSVIVNRTMLPAAPLAVVLGCLLWRQLTQSWEARFGRRPERASDAALPVVSDA